MRSWDDCEEYNITHTPEGFVLSTPQGEVVQTGPAPRPLAAWAFAHGALLVAHRYDLALDPASGGHRHPRRPVGPLGEDVVSPMAGS